MNAESTSGRLGAVLTLLWVVSPLAAQTATGPEPPDDVTDLENVVVTSQFREESPIEVPIAVTAYDQGFLDDTGLDQLDSLSAFVPGLLVQEQSVNNPGFVIRGITSDDGASNIEPRVSVFQNGVSISRSRGSFVELFDLERIEVLKGPQGTLFGRSAQIGAVHLISARPQYRTEARARGEFGNFDQRWLEAMINAPLVDETVALRAAAVYRKRDGFLDNTEGEALNGTETAALRASLRWDIAANARFDLIANYSEDTPPGTSFKSGVIPALGGNTDPNSTASLNTFGGLIGGRDLGIDREIHDVTGILDLDLGADWRVTSTTAWREFESLEVFDPDIGDDFDGWAWRFVANYGWTPTQFSYFSHARGRRPEVIEDVAGEVDPALGQPVNFVVVPAETVDSFEIGYKGRRASGARV